MKCDGNFVNSKTLEKGYDTDVGHDELTSEGERRYRIIRTGIGYGTLRLVIACCKDLTKTSYRVSIFLLDGKSFCNRQDFKSNPEFLTKSNCYDIIKVKINSLEGFPNMEFHTEFPYINKFEIRFQLDFVDF